MNRNETIQILSTLKAAFPNAYKGMSRADSEAMIALWCRLFADDEYATVGRAVDALITTREAGWTPSIGEVKSEIAKLKPADFPSEDEAWLMASKACKNGYYHSEREFAKLPPIVQETVGSPNQLKEWAMMSEDEVRDRISVRFKKAYRARLEVGVRESKLPSDLKAVSALADKLRLPS